MIEIYRCGQFRLGHTIGPQGSPRKNRKKSRKKPDANIYQEWSNLFFRYDLLHYATNLNQYLFPVCLTTDSKRFLRVDHEFGIKKIFCHADFEIFAVFPRIGRFLRGYKNKMERNDIVARNLFRATEGHNKMILQKKK